MPIYRGIAGTAKYIPHPDHDDYTYLPDTSQAKHVLLFFMDIETGKLLEEHLSE